MPLNNQIDATGSMPRIGEKRQSRCPSCKKNATFTYLGYTNGRQLDMGYVYYWNCSKCGSSVNPFKGEYNAGKDKEQ